MRAPHLLALAAFASELARVPSLVTREPAMGEIRLQWWRDALAAPDPGARTGNPVADAVRVAMHRCNLPPALLLDAIDAHEVDLALQPMPDDAALATYLWMREGALFALAAGVLGHEPGADVREAAVACGRAYGLTRLLLGLPHALSLGHLLLPQSRLDACNVSSQDTPVGRRWRQCRGPTCGDVCRSPRSPCHESEMCGEFAASGAGGLPSFGLGRDVFAGAGTAGA